jgi:surface protein
MLKFGDTYLKFGDTYLSGYKVPIYNVILQQSTGGTISASPLSGHRNTEVTLSNKPNKDYIFKGYEISGSNLYNTNKFKFEESDVTAHAKWYKNPNPLNLPPYTIRFKYLNGKTPHFPKGTGVQVSQKPNVWDLTYNNSNWSNLLHPSGNFSLIEILGANTSGVENMDFTFDLCSYLSSVKLFDTSNVTSMRGMFDRCSDLKTVPLFDTSKVTNMGSMFAGCYKLTTVPKFETSNVTSMRGMLGACDLLSSVPLFDTSKVTDMTNMFDYCYNLSSVPLFNTINVTSMNNMFGGCSALKSIPLFDTSNVTDMRLTFDGCNSLTSVPLFNTHNVVNMRYAFSCSSLKSIPLFDTSNVINMEGTFYNCKSIKYIPLFNTSKVTNMIETFRNCINVQSGALALYRQASTQAKPPTYHGATFENCGTNTTQGAAELAQIPNDWKTY